MGLFRRAVIKGHVEIDGLDTLGGKADENRIEGICLERIELGRVEVAGLHLERLISRPDLRDTSINKKDLFHHLEFIVAHHFHSRALILVSILPSYRENIDSRHHIFRTNRCRI
jgi:hypothetical protein